MGTATRYHRCFGPDKRLADAAAYTIEQSRRYREHCQSRNRRGYPVSVSVQVCPYWGDDPNECPFGHYDGNDERVTAWRVDTYDDDLFLALDESSFGSYSGSFHPHAGLYYEND